MPEQKYKMVWDANQKKMVRKLITLPKDEPTGPTAAQIRSQKAAELRKRIMPPTALDRLSEALTPKPKKKNER